MNEATCEPLLAIGGQGWRYYFHRREGDNGNQPRNATIPPFSDEHASIQPNLFVICHTVHAIATPADKSIGLGRKSGAEAGWLPDDDLTHRWLQYVKEYRTECEAAEEEESPNNEEAGEGTS